MKLSGGRLGVKSKLGCGSTFWVELREPLYTLQFIVIKLITTALGIGERALSEHASRPSMTHETSDSYSDRQRQMALGLEDLKFARAIGEGETPSTLIDGERMTVIDVALPPSASDETAADSALHSVEPPASTGTPSMTSSTQALHQVQSAPQTQIGMSSASLPATVSERALKNIMDQRGGFDIVAQPISALRAPQRAPIPPMTPPFTVVPPTPPQASETNVAAVNGDDGASVGIVGDGTLLKLPIPVSRAPHSAPAALEIESAASPTESTTTIKPFATTPSSTPSNPPAEKPYAGVRVLVVDDDPLTRTLMARMLQRLGCTVTLAENGRIALEKIFGGVLPLSVAASVPNLSNLDSQTTSFMPKREASGAEGEGGEEHVYLFDVVFLDNQMPVMSGLDTVTALRSIGRKDLVVGVTGNALASDQQEYLDVGVDRYGFLFSTLFSMPLTLFR